MPRPRPLVTAGIVLATVSLGVAACSDAGKGSDGAVGRPPTTTTAPAGNVPAAPTEVVEIGLAVALTGPDATVGEGLRNSAELAVRHANADHRVPGVTLRLVTLNTGTDDDGAEKAIARLQRRARVAAVIAPVPARSVEAVGKTLAADGLALLDPFDTDPALTGEPRPIASLFRLSADALDVAPFAADYVRDDLGATGVALAGDGGAATTGAIEAFAARFTAAGGTIVARLLLGPADDAASIADAVDTVRAAPAGAVVALGTLAASEALAAALVPAPPGQGPAVVAAGPDGCRPGGSTALPDGVLCVAPLASAALASARAFGEDYEAAAFAQPAGDGGPLTYDAATVIADALARVAAGGLPRSDLRAELATAVAAVRVQGATGTIAFDERGDAVTPVLSVLRAESGGWVAVTSRMAR